MRRALLFGSLLLLGLEGLARGREWGSLPPGPADAVRGVVVAAPPDAPTVVVLGDSIPWGYGLPDPQDAWPVRVGRALAERGTPWRVVDVSVPGETTLQGWARWKRDVRPWQPRRVLIAFGLNDAHLRFTPVDAWRWAHVPRGIGRYVRLWHAWRVRRLPPPPPDSPRWQPRLTPEQTATALAGILAAARRAGIEAWVLTPTPVYATFHPEWPRVIRTYQHHVYERTVTAIERTALAWGVRLMDVRRALRPPRAEWFQPDGVHLTAEGHRRVADYILAHWR